MYTPSVKLLKLQTHSWPTYTSLVFDQQQGGACFGKAVRLCPGSASTGNSSLKALLHSMRSYLCNVLCGKIRPSSSGALKGVTHAK